MTDQGQEPDPPESLQFDAVEPAGDSSPATGALVCAQCKRPIEKEYYEIKGHILCGNCKELLAASLAGNSGRGRITRAALFGVGAAVAGAALYYAVRAATGLEIGIIAIAVGWMVGRAVQRGSGGRGGWQYQTLAVGLTYLAIASTYVPLVIKELGRTHAEDASRSNPDTTGATPLSIESLAVTPASTSDSTTGPAPEAKKPASFLGIAGAVLVLLGLLISLPIIENVLNLPSGLLGLLIIFIGLLQAWRMNQRVDVVFNGPFQVGSGPRVGVTPA